MSLFLFLIKKRKPIATNRIFITYMRWFFKRKVMFEIDEVVLLSLARLRPPAYSVEALGNGSARSLQRRFRTLDVPKRLKYSANLQLVGRLEF
jgi:hypothetical protein